MSSDEGDRYVIKSDFPYGATCKELSRAKPMAAVSRAVRRRGPCGQRRRRCAEGGPCTRPRPRRSRAPACVGRVHTTAGLLCVAGDRV